MSLPKKDIILTSSVRDLWASITVIRFCTLSFDTSKAEKASAQSGLLCCITNSGPFLGEALLICVSKKGEKGRTYVVICTKSCLVHFEAREASGGLDPTCNIGRLLPCAPRCPLREDNLNQIKKQKGRNVEEERTRKSGRFGP